eukprot:scaffold124607_cov63-Phaeocystis_antarctica.AAC.1
MPPPSVSLLYYPLLSSAGHGALDDGRLPRGRRRATQRERAQHVRRSWTPRLGRAAPDVEPHGAGRLHAAKRSTQALQKPAVS